ncbi:TPA: DUF551 domain-containing protein [Klebsiella pneumoniae]
MELSRMALAAMDSSESVELPLDYLQGHKDGLEWAARLAEANHPDTGDWLYDDPIELAKAIRKGPDMPPAQPAADSEPVAWTWQHLKQWYVTNDEERARELAWDGVKVEQLYRHAQPVPVVSADLLHTAASAIEDLLTTKDRTGACVWFDLPFRLRSAANAHSAPVVPDDVLNRLEHEANHITAWHHMDEHSCMVNRRDLLTLVNSCRAAMLKAQPQNAPQNIPEIIPGGLLEAVNNLLNNDGSRGCYDAMECNAAHEKIELWLAQRQRWGEQRNANLSAGNSLAIGIDLASAPQSPGSEPATVPGSWIPVSERMPENDGVYLCWDNRYVTTYAFIFGGWQANQFIAKNITHWMPLPNPPRRR